MRRGIIMLICILVALGVLVTYNNAEISISNTIAQYYIENFVEDTKALNGVTAIYLNYRVFDTIFEALILLVSVMAVINFSWRKNHEE